MNKFKEDTRVRKKKEDIWSQIENPENFDNKDTIIESPYSDLKVEILNNGWTSIIAENGNKRISLGNYPNKRFEILKEMFDKLEELKCEHNVYIQNCDRCRNKEKR